MKFVERRQRLVARHPQRPPVRDHGVRVQRARMRKQGSTTVVPRAVRLIPRPFCTCCPG
jgi:hypothetical protein